MLRRLGREKNSKGVLLRSCIAFAYNVHTGGPVSPARPSMTSFLSCNHARNVFRWPPFLRRGYRDGRARTHSGRSGGSWGSRRLARSRCEAVCRAVSLRERRLRELQPSLTFAHCWSAKAWRLHVDPVLELMGDQNTYVELPPGNVIRQIA